MTIYPPTVESTSDDRTVNNVMRHEYRVLNQSEKDQMKLIKDEGEKFLYMLEDAKNDNNRRELALAKTKLEEAVMWAVKGITK